METRPTIPTPSGSPPPLMVEQVGESRTNVVGATIAGIIAAVVCAIIWAGIVSLTGFRIGYISVFVGLIVGLAVRTVGRKTSMLLGFISAIWSLGGVVLGDFLSVAPVVSRIRNESIFELLSSAKGLGYMASSFTHNFEITSLFFYALAVYIGFMSAARAGQRGIRS